MALPQRFICLSCFLVSRGEAAFSVAALALLSLHSANVLSASSSRCNSSRRRAAVLSLNLASVQLDDASKSSRRSRGGVLSARFLWSVLSARFLWSVLSAGFLWSRDAALLSFRVNEYAFTPAPSIVAPRGEGPSIVAPRTCKCVHKLAVVAVSWRVCKLTQQTTSVTLWRSHLPVPGLRSVFLALSCTCAQKLALQLPVAKSRATSKART